MGEDFLALKVLGAMGVLAVAAALRFDRPSHARSFTTPARFWVARVMNLTVHLLALIVVFLLVRQCLLAIGVTRPSAPLWIALAVSLLALLVPAIEVPLRLVESVLLRA